MAGRLHIDDAFPAETGGILRVQVGSDHGRENGRSQFERPFKGGLEMDSGGRVGRVRVQFEMRVGRLVHKVDFERRVGRARLDAKGATRFVLECGEEGEIGKENAVREKVRRRLSLSVEGPDWPILSFNLDFGGVAIILTEGIDLDLDGGIWRLDVKRRRGVERALDRRIFRMNGNSVADKILM
jgi:hypothetical protein